MVDVIVMKGKKGKRGKETEEKKKEKKKDSLPSIIGELILSMLSQVLLELKEVYFNHVFRF